MPIDLCDTMQTAPSTIETVIYNWQCLLQVTQNLNEFGLLQLLAEIGLQIHCGYDELAANEKMNNLLFGFDGEIFEDLSSPVNPSQEARFAPQTLLDYASALTCLLDEHFQYKRLQKMQV